MPVRLTVVMNQTPPANASAQRLGESIVGEMIGRPGIDMVLVNSASLEDPESTDTLTLKSLAGDFVYLDWKTPQASVATLALGDIHGRRTPHPDDLSAPTDQPAFAGRTNTEPPADRRIYVFDLNLAGAAGEVCKAVYGLLASRQVRTFSLGTAAAGSKSPAATVAGNVPVTNGSQAKTIVKEPSQPAFSLRAVRDENAGKGTPPSVSPGSLSGTPAARRLSNDQLDELVNRLNDDELV